MVTLQLESEHSDRSQIVLTGGHCVSARASSSPSFSPVPAGELCAGMEVQTLTGAARVRGKQQDMEMLEVLHVVLEPEDAVAYLRGEGDAIVAVHGSPPPPGCIRIDRCRRSVYVVPMALAEADSAGGPHTRSDPGLSSQELPARRPIYREALPLSVVSSPDPSQGSKGHPDLCAGACPHFADAAGKGCRFGLACLRCHVRGCTAKHTPDGSRARRKRRAASSGAADRESAQA